MLFNLLTFFKAKVLIVRFTKSSLYYKVFVFFLVLSVNASIAFAQFDDPSTPGEEIGDPGYDPDVQVPIDGGVSLLVAAGVAYGVKRAYDKRKQHKESDIA